MGSTVLCVQTAHDPQYLVKHLLSDLPAVTERVKSMRQARGGGNVEDNKNRMFASQEAYLKVHCLRHSKNPHLSLLVLLLMSHMLLQLVCQARQCFPS